MNTYVTQVSHELNQWEVVYAGNSFEAAKLAGNAYSNDETRCTIQIWENGNLSIELSLAEL
jgi:hypothetical protein